MKPFNERYASVMNSMFVLGWVLLLFSTVGADIVGRFAWWNVVPFVMSMLMLLISGPSVNGRLWSWIWLNWFGGSGS
jgi:hypothetical protein